MKKKKIIFTGGGSGGHVVPALTLIDHIDSKTYDVIYFGSYQGVESKLTKGKVSRYIPVLTGKLRRYFSIQNFIDIFKLGLGLVQSFIYLLILRASSNTVISMGGFVSVPIVICAKILGYRIFVHEQTSRVGLANKIASKFAKNVFISFEDSKKFFPSQKVIISGYPVRSEFLRNELAFKSYKCLDLISPSRPILFITGGGNGSKILNDKIKESLTQLKKEFFVIHQVGSGFIDEYLSLADKSYFPTAFIGDEMSDLMKSSRYIISRSGAGTVCELMTLGKPSLFVPLKIAQKNEQYHNAMEANKAIGSIVKTEDEYKEQDLLTMISEIPDTSVKSKASSEAVDIILSKVLDSK